MIDLKLAAVAKETIRITEDGYYKKDGCRIVLPGKNIGDGFAEVTLLTDRKLKGYLQEKERAKKTASDDYAKFMVFNADAYTVARGFERPLVMSFSNPLYPGGTFLNGGRSQEESLCRNSTLYASLTAKAAHKMYDQNRKVNSQTESDYMLLSPNVAVFRDGEGELLEESYLVSVISTPAPNRNGKAKGMEQEKLDKVMKHRLRLMLSAAIHYGYQNLVLGTWGCGHCGHEPKRVARYFYEVFVEEGFGQAFEHVVFAILKDEEKMQMFKETFCDQIDDYCGEDDLMDDYDLDGDYYEAIKPFPVCNHTAEVGKENLGYVQGIFFDGIPFEAELWEYGDSTNVSFVFPKLWRMEEPKESIKEGNVVGFHERVQRTFCCALTVGMVDNGAATDFNTTLAYIEYLKEKEVISFVTDVENGSVLYVTDIEGHDLVHVIITLRENGECLAHTPLGFHDFPNRPRKSGIRIVK